MIQEIYAKLAEPFVRELAPAPAPAFEGCDPVYPTPYRVGETAAAVIGAVAAAVGALHRARTRKQTRKDQEISVDVRRAAASLTGFYYMQLDGEPLQFPEISIPTTGLYQTADGRMIHLHGGFPHFSQGTLDLLGAELTPESVAARVLEWQADALEDALAEAAQCGVIARTPDQWRDCPQGRAVAAEPLVAIEKIGDSAPETIADGDRPLGGIRVLDLTRVLAGPTCARTLAEYGAQVLKIAAPHLASIAPFVMDTGHGKRSAYLDLRDEPARENLLELVRGCDVFSQGFRSGSLDERGFSSRQLHTMRPGIIQLSINCYGHTGPWAERRGWEQLAQAATGLATGHGTPESPELIPAALNDYISGSLAALGTIVALIRRAREGGSYSVKVSLCRTAMWIEGLGKLEEAVAGGKAERAGVISLGGIFSDDELAGWSTTSETPWGQLRHLAPIAQMSETQPHWELPAVPLGTHPPEWE